MQSSVVQIKAFADIYSQSTAGILVAVATPDAGEPEPPRDPDIMIAEKCGGFADDRRRVPRGSDTETRHAAAEGGKWDVEADRLPATGGVAAMDCRGNPLARDAEDFRAARDRLMPRQFTAAI